MNTSSSLNSPKIFPITRASRISEIHQLIEGGESLNRVLEILDQDASSAAIIELANTNKMIGAHRLDFQALTKEILERRKSEI